MKRVETIHSDNDIARMIRALRNIHHRYGLLFWLGVDTGLRISDLIQIRAGIVLACKEAGYDMRIMQRKTQQPVTVTLSKKMLELIEGYVQNEGLEASDFVFYSSSYKKGTPVSRQHVWRVFRKIAASEGIFGVGTHTMRRTFAARHYREHHNLIKLQERLGHKYITSTLNYLMQPDGTMISG